MFRSYPIVCFVDTLMKKSEIRAEDVARVVAAPLANPQPHIGKIYHLAGPQSENMYFYAQEHSKALARTILSGHSGRAVAGRVAQARLPVADVQRSSALRAYLSTGLEAAARKQNFAREPTGVV